MTAADLTLVKYVDDLPSLAAHPLVTVLFDLNPDRLGECGICCNRPGGDPDPATMRILYDQWNQSDMATDVCSHEHADEELLWLIGAGCADGNPRNIRLRVLASLSSSPAPEPARTPPVQTDEDETFARIHDLKLYVQTLPNPGKDEAVEAFRNKVLAAVASLGLARIEQLGRAA